MLVEQVAMKVEQSPKAGPSRKFVLRAEDADMSAARMRHVSG